MNTNKKLSKPNCHLSLIMALAITFALPLKAQVNIGSLSSPHPFSILELTTTANNHGGLRMPQLNNDERASVQAKFNENTATAEAAKGLIIYNTETGCLEFWNGNEWISLCSDLIGPTIPSPNSDPLADGTSGLTTFTNVMYDFQHQTLEAYLTDDATPTAFQWQMSVDGGTTWLNIVKATSQTYTVPPDFMYDYAGMDKNNKTQSESNSSIEVFFRCLITDNNGRTGHTPDANLLKILFIRTNTAGYDIDPTTGVRYLTINRGGSLNGGKINIALLNLGQSGTGSLNQNSLYDDSRNLNDAGDLGDFYQWGRVADGYQQTVWSKDLSTRENQIIPMTGNGATSLPVAGTNVAMSNLDGNGQVLSTATGYGSFITNNGDWVTGTDISGRNDLWGNTYNSRFTGANGATSSPISLKDVPPIWTSKAQSNNPCPTGWRVPSRFELWDIYRGDGSKDPVLVTSGAYDVSNTTQGEMNNTWRWRAGNFLSDDGTPIVIGGAIITNPSTGEKVFMPAAGCRLRNDGTLGNIGDTGYFWSSTYDNNQTGSAASAYSLYFGSGYMYAGNYSNYLAYGFSVRCVSE